MPDLDLLQLVVQHRQQLRRVLIHACPPIQAREDRGQSGRSYAPSSTEQPRPLTLVQGQAVTRLQLLLSVGPLPVPVAEDAVVPGRVDDLQARGAQQKHAQVRLSQESMVYGQRWE
jgi:hypothetical protein